jgi:hypothetical protein
VWWSILTVLMLGRYRSPPCAIRQVPVNFRASQVIWRCWRPSHRTPLVDGLYSTNLENCQLPSCFTLVDFQGKSGGGYARTHAWLLPSVVVLLGRDIRERNRPDCKRALELKLRKTINASNHPAVLLIDRPTQHLNQKVCGINNVDAGNRVCSTVDVFPRALA